MNKVIERGFIFSCFRMARDTNQGLSHAQYQGGGDFAIIQNNYKYLTRFQIKKIIHMLQKCDLILLKFTLAQVIYP